MADFLRDHASTGKIGLRQHHRELLATQPRAPVELARQALDQAAVRNHSVIDGAFVRALVDGSAPPIADVADRRVASSRDARVIDDILA